jgi:2,4-dienoyl-CoA reductase-like NADH-dependent reductase (Old Yellow Enzyme family)
MTQKNEINGYSLFNDIDDENLRIRNRAVVMANMCQNNMKKDKISPKGMALVVGYFNAIKDAVERSKTIAKFEIMMEERGYAKASASTN